jgi:hypothetical protein
MYWPEMARLPKALAWFCPIWFKPAYDSFQIIPECGINLDQRRHPGNANGVIRDRYKRRRLFRSRIASQAASGMTGAEVVNRI